MSPDCFSRFSGHCVFGSVIPMDKGNECVLIGIVGGCHYQVKTKASNIAELAAYREAIGDFVFQLHMSTNKIFNDFEGASRNVMFCR